MAAGYAVLFLTLLRRKDFPAFLIASGFAVLYNIPYDTVVRWRWAVALALLLRLLPPIEACWKAGRKDTRVALSVLLAAVTWGCLNPYALAWGYLTVRTMVTTSIALVCGMTWTVEAAEGRAGLNRSHLALQTVWTTLHAVFSMSAGWYNRTWERRGAARWLYVLASLGIILIYQRLLRNPPAHRAADPEDAVAPQR